MAITNNKSAIAARAPLLRWGNSIRKCDMSLAKRDFIRPANRSAGGNAFPANPEPLSTRTFGGWHSYKTTDAGTSAVSRCGRKIGAPGTIRTCDRLVRSQVLYPAELRALYVGCGGRVAGSWENSGLRWFPDRPGGEIYAISPRAGKQNPRPCGPHPFGASVAALRCSSRLRRSSNRPF